MSVLADLTSLPVPLPAADLNQVCQEFEVQELWVFGSVLRDDFAAGSDVDFLVTFQKPDVGPWMSKLSDFEAALSRLSGRKADVVLKSSLEQSENYIRRKHILANARVLYVA